MRSLIFALPILAVVAVLQSAVFSHIRFLSGGFDVMLIVVVAWSLAQRGNDGPVWAFVGGVLSDALSGGPPGAITLSLAVVTFFIALTEGRFYKANWPVALLASVLSTLMYHLIYLALLALAGRPVSFADTLTLTTFPSAILNFLLMLPAYQAAKWLAVLTTPPKVEIG
ncbi:MAG TPA: rod shape-determining protein MreD [Anaerolineales bacterium]|nr:rod shape-determining protein MreD [Anaerolineales bacterium]